jgi:hypothetical protein
MMFGFIFKIISIISGLFAFFNKAKSMLEEKEAHERERAEQVRKVQAEQAAEDLKKAQLEGDHDKQADALSRLVDDYNK